MMAVVGSVTRAPSKRKQKSDARFPTINTSTWICWKRAI